VDRLLVAAALLTVVGVVAIVASRRRPDAPTQPTWTVPAALDRADFARPDAPWLVAVFSSATCAGCHEVTAAAEPLASEAVVVDEVELGARRDLHERYSIDAVPTLVIVDAEGVVRDSFVGPVGAAELWARVAELRA
jgi:Thioredoxin